MRESGTAKGEADAAGAIPAGGGKIRVLVVDDSVVVRRLITNTLGSESDLEVAGVAANGRLALDRVGQLKPDVVTLDIEMPEMDGLATLRELRKDHPRLPVIMFSTLTERGAAATIDALSLGATDYVTKPANCGSVGASVQALREELIPKLKAVVHARRRSALPGLVPAGAMPGAARRPVVTTPALPSAHTLALGSRPAARPAIWKPLAQAVVVGVSTGGPNALAALISQLPADFPLPVLVVQHMPPMFTRLLASRLSAVSKLTVTEAQEGEAVRAGCVYIAPGDFHMEVCRQGFQAVIRLHQQAAENSCRPAVDVLFRSARQCYAGAVLAVVLTGMGEDGLRGTRILKEAGATVLAQDEASSVVWGMPGFIVREGLADQVLPIECMAPAIHALAAPGKEGPQ